MSFHSDKCITIRFTRKRHPIIYQYQLHNHTLSTQTNAKYLGVTFSADLRWNTHIKNITTQANQTLSLVRRNIRIGSPTIKQRAYQALVCPKLEYAAAVWDPHTQTNTKLLESVQRRAARWTMSRYHNTSSVTAMLEHLGWRSLQNRRIDIRLCLMFKIVNRLVAINHLENIPHRALHMRLNHNLTHIPILTTKDVYRYSFLPNTIMSWNALPASVVAAPSIDAFRSKVSAVAHLRP